MRISLEELRKIMNTKYVWDKPLIINVDKGRRGPNERREYVITGIIVEPVDRRIIDVAVKVDRRKGKERRKSNRRRLK